MVDVTTKALEIAQQHIAIMVARMRDSHVQQPKIDLPTVGHNRYQSDPQTARIPSSNEDLG